MCESLLLLLLLLLVSFSPLDKYFKVITFKPEQKLTLGNVVNLIYITVIFFCIYDLFQGYKINLSNMYINK